MLFFCCRAENKGVFIAMRTTTSSGKWDVLYVHSCGGFACTSPHTSNRGFPCSTVLSAFRRGFCALNFARHFHPSMLQSHVLLLGGDVTNNLTCCVDSCAEADFTVSDSCSYSFAEKYTSLQWTEYRLGRERNSNSTSNNSSSSNSTSNNSSSSNSSSSYCPQSHPRTSLLRQQRLLDQEKSSTTRERLNKTWYNLLPHLLKDTSLQQQFWELVEEHQQKQASCALKQYNARKALLNHPSSSSTSTAAAIPASAIPTVPVPQVTSKKQTRFRAIGEKAKYSATAQQTERTTKKARHT